MNFNDRPKHRQWGLALVSWLAAGVYPLQAEEASIDLAANLAHEDQEWLSELTQVLDESTEIATKSRLNADYVPGMVTVLQGRDLEALGMRTVWDALALIPGVMINQSIRGEPFVAVRGFSSSFNSGNVKVLLNSIPMSRDESGLSSQALLLPIEQVERIEFIRGPGAVLYGDFAYQGVLNILTRQGNSRISMRVDQHGTTTSGGLYSYQSEDGLTRFSLNMAGSTGHWVEAPVGIDVENEQQSGIVLFSHHGFELTAQAINEDYDDDQGISRTQRTETIAVRQSFDPMADTQISLYASYLNNDFTEARERFLGQVWEGRAELVWRGMEHHHWLLQFSYTDSHTEEALRGTSPPNDGPGFSRYDISHRYYGISLQDQYEASEHVTFTAGLRFDRRDDLDENLFHPRLAAVWQISETNILKAQYTSGYRAPTFWELFSPPTYADTDVDPETISTSELSYIHRQMGQVLRLTLFDSRLKDHITPVRLPGGGLDFDNIGASETTGVELEWEQQWSPRLKSWLNLSYADARDGHVGNRLEKNPTTTDWLGNLALFYRPTDWLLFTMHWNYLGKRHSDQVDSDAEHRIAMTLNWFNVWTKGLTLRLGVRNLLQADQRYLIREFPPLGITASTFPDRLIWGQISYDF
ncbi:MAG: TonB-dependent receptor [Gammaproteobacteria bacterium]|nr:TonB-dependent receptor [Gammaproteobacteria bacterium]MCP5195958.1 TonB-dependent receptor [Gammaproteobacteria bacterium]